MKISDLTVAGDDILFVFKDQTAYSDGKFQETVGSLAVASNVDMSVKRPRWVIVKNVGPDVKDPRICVGAEVMLRPLQWTHAIDCISETFWGSNERSVLAVRK